MVTEALLILSFTTVLKIFGEWSNNSASEGLVTKSSLLISEAEMGDGNSNAAYT